MKGAGVCLDLKVIPSGPTELNFGWYGKVRKELLRKTIGQARAVLDIGCRRGQVLLSLANRIGQGTGIDLSREDLVFAERNRKRRKITNIRFRRLDARRLPFGANTFDRVLCLGDVLSYGNLFGKTGRVISGIHRVLKPGGIAAHDCMNWDWEFRSYPPRSTSFTRRRGGYYFFHRCVRTPNGTATYYDYQVLPGTPLFEWVKRQKWPVSPGQKTQLQVSERERIPGKWLKYRGANREQNFTSRKLEQAYMKAGFRSAVAIPYGQIFDIAVKAGKLRRISPFQKSLVKAEAELCLGLHQGAGPWLFLIARK